MKEIEIIVGSKYSNPSIKYGEARVVDVIFRRSNGDVAVTWSKPKKKGGQTGGVSTLNTFAKWARFREALTELEEEAHKRRVEAHGVAMKSYGEWAERIASDQSASK
jgi:hypothetical protein